MSITVVVIALGTLPRAAAHGQEPAGAARIDDNALADALMGWMGANLGDDTSLFDDVPSDAERAAVLRAGDAKERAARDEAARIQREEVVPIAGDSAPPPDEVMDEPAPSFRLVSFRPAAPAFGAPVAIFSTAADGLIDMRVFSAHGLSADEERRLLHRNRILAPVDAASARSIQQWITDHAPIGSGVHVTRLTVRGYCVEPGKLAPGAHQMFITAPKADQAQFAPAFSVRLVGEFAARGGYLRSQGDAGAYGRFITQYAIWTKLEHWDQTRFTNEFIARAKAVRKTSDAEIERTLRTLAPARWRDVQLVVNAAARVDERLRTRRDTRW